MRLAAAALCAPLVISAPCVAAADITGPARVLDGDTLLIYPNTAAKAADYREMVVRSFYVSNADINKTSAMIKAITKAKDIFVDERVNLLVVRDSAEVIRLAERLIAAQDMPEPEVMLELEVLEISVNRLLSMGIRWPNAVSAGVQGSRGAGVLTLPELKEGGEGPPSGSRPRRGGCVPLSVRPAPCPCAPSGPLAPCPSVRGRGGPSSAAWR